MSAEGQEPEVRFLGDVQRLQLAPGDILVLSSSAPLSHETVQRIRDGVAELVGRDRPIMVLDNGLKVGVLAPSETGE